MTVLDQTPGGATGADLLTAATTPSETARRRLSSPWASLAALVIAVLWTLPTFGLFLSSLRPQRDVQRSGWWTFFANPNLTIENYADVLLGGREPLVGYFVNSLLITLPAVLIPIVLATLAAYAFAWTRFPLRDTLFVAIFALQIVPLQVALLPLLEFFVDVELNNTFWTVWIAHSTFALPLAIFLLHNAMREIPAELVEAARVDGAGHVRIFTTIMLPLIRPAIAAYAVFQFLWVWNDLLVALVFVGGTGDVAPLTVQIADLEGSLGSQWHLRATGAFVSIIVPLIVFFSLQRYFVRGLLAGSVKG
jgi:alpha-glucoside transport system permease protein